MKFFLSIGCIIVLFVWDLCEEQAFSLTNEESGNVSATARSEANFTKEPGRDSTKARLERNFTNEESGSVSTPARLERNFTNEESGSVSTPARLETNFTNEESGSASTPARLETNFTNEESGSVSTPARLETNFTNEHRRRGFTNAQSNMNFQFRIIGGELADILEFPYIVSVQYQHEHHCGGSLLSTTLVLTAAHCCYNMKKYRYNNDIRVYDIGDISVLVGTKVSDYEGFTVLDERSEKRGVIAMFGHENFDMETMSNDIGVMKLSYPVRLSTKVKLLPRPRAGRTPRAGALCTAVGWGLTNPQAPGLSMQGGPETLLRKVSLSVLDAAECQRAYERHPISQTICTYTTGKDACAGDSGGPLLCDGVQVAVTSFGEGCAAVGKPGVFQRIDIHLRWLNDTAARALNAASRCGSTSWPLPLCIFTLLFFYLYFK